MKKTTILTTFIRELIYLIDKGKTVSLNDLIMHIEKKDVIDWLINRYPRSENNVFDLSLLNEQKYKKYLEDKFERFNLAYNIKTKWGTNNNGLCTLISMSTISLEEAVKESEKIDA